MFKKHMWKILLATLLLSSLVLTGCGGGEVAPTEEAPAPVEASNELEIYSWWAGDEGPALEALISDEIKQAEALDVDPGDRIDPEP